MTNITTDDLKELYQNFNIYCAESLHLNQNDLRLISISNDGELRASFYEFDQLDLSSWSVCIETMDKFLQTHRSNELNLRYNQYLKLKEEFEPKPPVNKMIYGTC